MQFKRIIRIAALLCTCACIASLSAQTDSLPPAPDTLLINSLIREARQMNEQGQFANAYRKGADAIALLKGSDTTSRRLLADALHQTGVASLKVNRLTESRMHFQRSLWIREQVLEKNHADIARSSNNLANAFFYLGQYDSCLFYNRKALAIRLKILPPDHLDIAASYTGMGTAFSGLWKMDSCQYYHRKALTIRQKKLSPNDPQLANSFCNLGNCATRSGRFAEANHYLDSALLVLQPITRKTANDSVLLAYAYNSIGINFSEMHQADSAIWYYSIALRLAEKMYGRKDKRIGSYHFNIGIAQYYNGDYRSSIHSFETSLELAGEKPGKETYKAAGAISGIGANLSDLGDFDGAIRYFQKSLDLHLKNPRPDSAELSYLYTNLGRGYAEKDNPDQAVHYFRKGYQLIRQSVGNQSPRLLTHLYNLGELIRRSHPDSSLWYHREALRIATAGSGEGSIATARPLFGIGLTLALEGRYPEAVDHMKQALLIRSRTYGNFHPEVAAAKTELARIFLLQGRESSCLEMLGAAKESLRYSAPFQFDELLNTDILLNLLMVEFRYYRNKGGLKDLTKAAVIATEAEAAIFDAFDRHSQVLRNLQEPGAFNHFSRSIYSVCENAISVNLQLFDITRDSTYLNDCFRHCERAKAYLLGQGMEGISLTQHYPESSRIRENELRKRIAELEKYRFDQIYRKNLPETDPLVLQTDSHLADLKNEYKQFQDGLKKDCPECFATTGRSVSVQSLRSEQLRPGQTLLEYFDGDSAIYLFVISKTRFGVFEIRKDFPLDVWVEKFRNGIQIKADRNADIDTVQSGLASYIQAASDLYERLLKPAAPMLDSLLLIIPDGALYYLPFEALLVSRPVSNNNLPQYPFLIREKTIAYAQSAGLWADMVGRQHKPGNSFLAMAPFSGDHSMLVGQRRMDLPAKFGPLPGSKQEVERVIALAGGVARYDTAATSGYFLENADRFQYLLLAQHAVAHRQAGDYSFIVFYDTVVYVRDVYNLKIAADMVTLSACETAYGELRRGEGVIGMTRAFTFAGAKSLFVTLWKVDDMANSRVVQDFYTLLFEADPGLSKDQALRRAKLDLIESDRRLAHPYFWAGLIGVGDMRPIR